MKKQKVDSKVRYTTLTDPSVLATDRSAYEFTIMEKLKNMTTISEESARKVLKKMNPIKDAGDMKYFLWLDAVELCLTKHFKVRKVKPTQDQLL